MSDVDIKKRNLLKGASVGVLGAAALAAYSPTFPELFQRTGAARRSVALETDSDIKLVRSVCLQCHGACGIQGRIANYGTDNVQLLKIDGNPFHPSTRSVHLEFDTSMEAAKSEPAHICAKGQAGLQTMYDEQRLTQPLKRVGPRGSGKWEPIEWDDLYKELIEGAELAKKDGGTYTFDGFKALIADGNGNLTTQLIDPDKPWLGTTANQILFSVGRSEHGRKEVSDRIFGKVFGTINKRIDHTCICEQSHHIAYKRYTNGKKSKMHPDFDSSKFVMTFGGSYLDAQFPFNALADKVTRFKVNGGRLIVADPHFSNTAKHADIWFPVIPGTDAALALAFARYRFEENVIDETFLSAPNQAAANANGELSWTNSTWLVNTSTGDFVTMEDVGKASSGDAEAGNPVVWDGSDYQDATTATSGILFPGKLTVGGSDVYTSIELYKNESMGKTIDQWLEIAGLSDLRDKFDLACKWMVEAGKKVVFDMYRGAVQHTNGYYNGISILLLNALAGNQDWKGGPAVGGGHWHEMGKGTTYNGLDKLGTTTVPNDTIASDNGYSIWKATREGIKWGPGNPEYDMRVANGETDPKPQRPFYPLTSMVWQEMFGVIETGYPYPIKIFINHMGNPNYSIPGSSKVQEVLESVDEQGVYKLPLLISVDVVMGEASAYSDYVVPDVTYLERFATPHLASTITTKGSPIRQPMFGEYDPSTGDYKYNPVPGFEKAKMAEDFYIELAVKLKEEYGVKLTGVGKDAFGPGEDLYNAWDWYKRAFINFAEEYEAGGGTLEGSTIEEKIGYMLDRGGLYESYTVYEESGDMQPHGLKNQLNIWDAKTATTTHSMTGERFWGTARYEPIKDMKGKLVQDEDRDNGFTFILSTYKLSIHAQSRTANNHMLKELLPENYLEVNKADGEALGLKTGDMVRVTSATNSEGAVVPVYLTNMVRPGVVTFAHSFGHTQYGAAKRVEGDKTIKGDSHKAGGFNLNTVMRLDTSYADNEGVGAITLTDPIGGSAVFYDSMVKLEKV